MIRLGLLIMCACMLAGCGKATDSDSTTSANSPKKIIKAAVCPTSPPNCFQKEKEYTGIDVDIFTAFCESKGYELEMTAYDWAGMLGSVIAKRVDVAFSGISITEKRKEVMSFSVPYMINVLIIAGIKDSGIVMNSTADWKKYKLGFVRGMYFGDLIKNTYAAAYTYSNLKQYPSYNELLADLGNRKIDGAFMDSLVMADQLQKGIYDITTLFTLEEDDKFGFAFPKDSPMRDEFNQFLEENKTQVQAIIDRYMK